MKDTQQMKDQRSRQRGFTLIEIMIVLAIMALIFSLVGVNVVGSFKDAKKKTCAIQIAKYKESLDAFYLANGFYPSSSQGLAALVKKPASGSGRTPENYPDGGFTKKIENDPWGSPYVYESDDQQNYVIYSAGPDGKAETQEDNVKAE